MQAVEATIVLQANAFRRANRRLALKQDPVLTAAARAYARYLARTNKFSHTADGRQPMVRAKASGYKACLVRENLALFMRSRGFKTAALARRMMTGWKNSPGHRRNLLAPLVQDIGVGIARAGRRHRYIGVQLFGRSRRLSYRFEVLNGARQTVAFRVADKNNRIRPDYKIRMTACAPMVVTFTLSDTLKPQYQARDGLVFVLSGGQKGPVNLTVRNAPDLRANTVRN